MTEAAHYLSAPSAPPDSSPALENNAVAHCCEVWEFTRRQALNAGNSTVLARVAAFKAFQKALPPLTGLENIRTFIAYITHDMLIGTIHARRAYSGCMPLKVAEGAAPRPAPQPETSGE